MSIAAISWAWHQHDLRPIAKFVLVALCDYADARGESCWPGQRALCMMTALSDRAVRNALDDLEQCGKIERQARRFSGRFISDSYRILCDSDHLVYQRQPAARHADGPAAPDADGPAAPDADGQRHQMPMVAAPDADGPAAPDADGYIGKIRQKRSVIEPSMDPPDSAGKKAAQHKARKSKLPPVPVRWPEDLALSDDMREFAQRYGVNPEAEFVTWRDDCAAHDRRYRDWQAAWRTRIQNFERYGSARNRLPVPAVNGAQGYQLPTQHRLSPGMAEGALLLAEFREAEENANAVANDPDNPARKRHLAGPNN